MILMLLPALRNPIAMTGSYSNHDEHETAPVTSIVLSPTTPRETILVASLDSKVRLMDRSNGQVSHVISESFPPSSLDVPSLPMLISHHTRISKSRC
jgi:WD40 repeat protein